MTAQSSTGDLIQVIRMVTVSVTIPVESFFFSKEDKFSRDITMLTSSTCIIGVELSSRIGSEEIAIHCSCSAIICSNDTLHLFINARMNKAACSKACLPMPVSACTNHNVTTSGQWRRQSYMIKRDLACSQYPCRNTLNWHIDFQFPGLDWALALESLGVAC